MHMNQSVANPAGRSLVTGTIAAAATAIVASLAGRQETGSYSAPLNATSHVLWGDIAGKQNRPSLKYTLTGFLLNHGAAIFWAAIYETLFPPKREDVEKSPLRPLLGAAMVTAGAYVTDYYLVPRRFTPGFEKRLSGKSMAMIYGVLALAMATRALVERRR